jgi:hypothetical protein
LVNKSSQDLFSLTASYDNGNILDLIEGITNVKVFCLLCSFHPNFIRRNSKFQILLTQNLPSKICKNCLASFLAADEIRAKFIESEEILRAMIEPAVTIKEEQEPEDFEVQEEVIKIEVEQADYDEDIEMVKPDPLTEELIEETQVIFL